MGSGNNLWSKDAPERDRTDAAPRRRAFGISMARWPYSRQVICVYSSTREHARAHVHTRTRPPTRPPPPTTATATAHTWTHVSVPFRFGRCYTTASLMLWYLWIEPNKKGQAIWNGTLPHCHTACSQDTKEAKCELDVKCLECTEHCRFANLNPEFLQADLVACVQCVGKVEYYKEGSPCNRRCGGMGSEAQYEMRTCLGTTQ